MARRLSQPGRIEEGTLLWEPSAAFIAGANLTDYLAWLERERGLRFADYGALWRWSVDDLEAFWTSIVDHYQIPLRGDRGRVLGSRSMPGATWFESAQINYAEAVFAHATPDHPALVFQSERQPLRAVSWGELEASVAAVAAGLRRLGVGRGDRVVA
ncbi:MAG: acetoacetyl-CoA synthetase, partial [Chloroflexota bacterium]|nr:acetoacetyl-CoA synthetase [Chloroflexota bacterium]